jgi:hypothetical protein
VPDLPLSYGISEECSAFAAPLRRVYHRHSHLRYFLFPRGQWP